MSAGFTTRLHYGEPMLRRAVRTFVIRRVLGSWLLIAAGAVLIAGALLALEGSAQLQLGFVLASLLFLIVFVVAVWRSHLASTIGRFRDLDPPEADMIATDDAVTFRSSRGSSTMPWSSFTELWELPDCWLLFLSHAQFVTLPLADIDPDARAFLRSILPVRDRASRPSPAAPTSRG